MRAIIIVSSILATAVFASVLPAQTNSATGEADSFRFGLPTGAGGIHLTSISGFTTYSSTAQEVFGNLNNALAGEDIAAGGSVTVSYTKLRERTGLSIVYSPSYVSTFLKSSAHMVNQYLVINWRRRLTPKWTFSVIPSAAVSSLRESLFLPTTLSNLVSPGAESDDSIQTVAGGGFSGLRGTIGAPLPDSAALFGTYGDRMLTAFLNSSLSYSFSSRLQFRANFGLYRTQNLQEATGSSGLLINYIIPYTTGASSGLGVGYALTPRTHLSMELGSSRTMTTIDDTYTSSTDVSVAHTLGRSWVLQARGGVGINTPLRETYFVSRRPQYQTGGSVVYKSRAHTFTASMDRRAGDSYGLGASRSRSATGAWGWASSRSSWSLTAGFGQDHLAGESVAALDTWRVRAGITRRLLPDVAISTQYAYLSNLIGGGSALQRGLHTVRVSVSWLPGERSRR